MVKYSLEMQLNNEKKMNSNKNQIESCTSSTDSGVILSDNNTTEPIVTITTTNQHKSNFNNNNKRIFNTTTERTATTIGNTTESDNKNIERRKDTVLLNNENNYLKQNGINNENSIYNVQKNINVRTAAVVAETTQAAETPVTKHQLSPFLNTKSNSNSNNSNLSNNIDIKHVTYSPTSSLRSTTISIESIDENAIDSSVVDSNSECEPDAEGVHSNYVIKKLGQQKTYEPNSPELQNLNKSLQVVGQTITPDVGNIAGNILNGGLFPSALQGSVPATTPKVGNVTVIDSTEVTFGDQHFYDGPVTIQQFLIDNRDGWKSNQLDGKDNPTLERDGNGSTAEDELNNKMDSQPLNQQQPYRFIFNRKAIAITGTIILLTIIIAVLLITLKPAVHKIIDEDCKNGTLCVVQRDTWGGQPPKTELDKLNLPVHNVIISHTATNHCDNQRECSLRVQNIQTFHMHSFNWDDIGYNFLIGGDGRVYVGRGFNYQGAHTKGYNRDSIGISFIGIFTSMEPTEQQLIAAKLIIEEGVLQHKLVPDYKIYGARQLSATESPGEALYRIIKTWAHWSPDIPTLNLLNKTG